MACATLRTVPAEMSRAANTPRPFPALSRTVTKSALVMPPPRAPAALLDERVQFLEFPGAGALEPLEHDHFGVDDIDAFLGEAGHRSFAILLGARACGVGDNESLEALSLEVD